MQPSLFCAITCKAGFSALISSFATISSRCSTVSFVVIRLKSNIWQRDKMVGMILCFSVVARIKMAYGGGSSNVFKNALNAEALNICTSSTIYTLYFPAWGMNRTCSTSVLISSTELLLAASSSCMFNDVPSLKLLQELQVLQASPSACRFSQLIVLARIRAQVVLPTPRGPQNK